MGHPFRHGGFFVLVWTYRGTSLIRKRPPPRTHLRTLCIVPLQGPRRALFLMSEVPLWSCGSDDQLGLPPESLHCRFTAAGLGFPYVPLQRWVYHTYRSWYKLAILPLSV